MIHSTKIVMDVKNIHFLFMSSDFFWEDFVWIQVILLSAFILPNAYVIKKKYRM